MIGDLSAGVLGLGQQAGEVLSESKGKAFALRRSKESGASGGCVALTPRTLEGKGEAVMRTSRVKCLVCSPYALS